MKGLGVLLLAMLIGAVVGRMVCPPTAKQGRNIPTIVTVHDTVRTLERDTVWRTRTVEHFTTDTFNLVIRETIYDTVVINPATSRLWPVASFDVRSRDSARVKTVELRTGRAAALDIWTPGPLHTMVADTTAVPRMTFGTYPNTRTGAGTKLLYMLGGYALCSATSWANRQLGNR